MIISKKDLDRIGIYRIYGPSGKCYIGQSKNIKNRLLKHRSLLNKSKHHSPHLQNAWNHYGSKAFKYEVLENCCINNLCEREAYWVSFYDSLKSGYNHGTDCYNLTGKNNPNYGNRWSDEQREKMSNIKFEQYSSSRCKITDEQKKNTSEFFKSFWKNNPDIKKEMSKKVAKKKQKYNFIQYDREMNFIKRWNSVSDIINENPTYKWQNIYSVCNGYKPTYMEFIWKKELKI